MRKILYAILVGDEFAKITFADGSTVTAFLPAGPSEADGTLSFDDNDLVPGGGTPVPLPATLPMLAAAVVTMGALRRRKEAGRA